MSSGTPADAMDHNGGWIHYETAGTGDALVLIHGFALDRRIWSSQITYFRDRFQVVAYDCRGFGRSSTPTGHYSHADDLRALLAHLGITNAHLAGLSMGGRIAINLAISHPELVGSLVLIGSDVGGHRFSFDWDPAGSTLPEMRSAWLSHEIFSGARRTPALLEAVTAMVDDYSGFHWRNDDPRRPGDLDAVDHLHRVKAPASIIVGGNDLPDFHAIARLLADHLPEAELTTVPAAGHLIPAESPGICNALIERHVSAFAGRREPGSA